MLTKKQRYAIIGLGKFGYYLAKELGRKDLEILCVDRDEAIIEQVSGFVSHAVVVDASRRDVLEDLGIPEMERVVVAVGRLTQSVLITLYLKEMGCNYILAKANDEDHATGLSLVGAHEIIIPERNTAIKVAQFLTTPNIVDFLPMLPEFCVAEVKAPKEFVGYTLAELGLRRKYHIYVLGIKDEKNGRIELMPPAEHIVSADKVFLFMGRLEHAQKIINLSEKASIVGQR